VVTIPHAENSAPLPRRVLLQKNWTRPTVRIVQRYLHLLEREGCIRVDVSQSQTTRMCNGLFVYLLRPLFPRHHSEKWLRTLAIPNATAELSQTKRI